MACVAIAGSHRGAAPKGGGQLAKGRGRKQSGALPQKRHRWLSCGASGAKWLAAAFIATAPAAVVTAAESVPKAAKKSGDKAAADGQASKAAAQALGKLPILRGGLDNGLRVVLSPNPGVPTIAIAVYYDVGARNEEQGRSGFAHLFEHMMFQGSQNVGKGQHFEYIMNRGGTLNGTTSADRTNYFETLPANELHLGLWLEADRMRSLDISAKNFENQRQTVMEERRQSIDNQPYMASMLRINELAYGDYWPYAHPTIGYMEDLKKAKLSQVQAFFDAYYGPNNAVLSIAGDFEPAPAMDAIRKYFGKLKPIKTRKYAPPAYSAPKALGTRETLVDDKAKLPGFHIAYPIPPSRTPDHYALEVLAMALGQGESSLLYQSLVKDKELCQQVHVGTDDRRGPDLFSLWAVVAANHTAGQAREVYEEHLEAIREKGLSARDLEKAKNQIRSAFVFGLQSNLARAMHLAEFELYWGDANLIRGELARYLAVSSEDIKRVASQYLNKDKSMILDVLPAPENPASAPSSADDQPPSSSEPAPSKDKL